MKQTSSIRTPVRAPPAQRLEDQDPWPLRWICLQGRSVQPGRCIGKLPSDKLTLQAYIYIPASPKAKFNEAFCNRPSLTRSFGLIEISPFSPHAHRRQAFRTLVLPKLQENLRNFAQSHMKNHSVLQKTQHVLKKSPLLSLQCVSLRISAWSGQFLHQSWCKFTKIESHLPGLLHPLLSNN